MYDKGGVFLDTDVVVLRDVRPLREAGFNGVVGRQSNGKVVAGCFMARRHAALAYVMQREWGLVFENGWRKHATELVTAVAERLAGSPEEVLILDQRAIVPGNWDDQAADAIFKPRNVSVPVWPQVNDLEEDPLARWYNKARSQEWEMDFSATYFLQSFQPPERVIEGYPGVSVKYVLARNSNYALAVWPIVQRGIKEGVFDETDDEP